MWQSALQVTLNTPLLYMRIETQCGTPSSTWLSGWVHCSLLKCTHATGFKEYVIFLQFPSMCNTIKIQMLDQWVLGSGGGISPQPAHMDRELGLNLLWCTYVCTCAWREGCTVDNYHHGPFSDIFFVNLHLCKQLSRVGSVDAYLSLTISVALHMDTSTGLTCIHYCRLQDVTPEVP